MAVPWSVGRASRTIPLQGASAHSLLGTDGIQLELPLRPALCHQCRVSLIRVMSSDSMLHLDTPVLADLRYQTGT